MSNIKALFGLTLSKETIGGSRTVNIYPSSTLVKAKVLVSIFIREASDLLTSLIEVELICELINSIFFLALSWSILAISLLTSLMNSLMTVSATSGEI